MADFLFCVLRGGIDARALRREVGLEYAASDQFKGRGASPDDTLWIVQCPDENELFLIGRIVIGRIVGRAEAEAALGRADLFCRATQSRKKKGRDGPEQFVLAKSGRVDWVRTVDISGIAATLRFVGPSDRLPPRFTGQHFQTLRILSGDSPILLEDRWIRARKPQESTNPT